MKIIKDNTGKNMSGEEIPKAFRIECEHCMSELEITEDETHIGFLGCAYITCPCCGKETPVDELEGVILTIDNIEFPTHFFRTNASLGTAKPSSNQEIKKEIVTGIEHLRKNKNSHFWYTSYGDLFLIVFRYPGDKEYWVVATKDYYDTFIPFEDIDYGEEK